MGWVSFVCPDCIVYYCLPASHAVCGTWQYCQWATLSSCTEGHIDSNNVHSYAAENNLACGARKHPVDCGQLMWGNKEHYLGWNLEGRRIWQYKVFKAEEMTIHNLPWWHCTRKLFPALTFNKASLSLFLTHDPCSRHTVMFQLPSQCELLIAL